MALVTRGISQNYGGILGAVVVSGFTRRGVPLELVIACAKDYALWSSITEEQRTALVVTSLVTALAEETTGVVYVFTDEDAAVSSDDTTAVDSTALDDAADSSTQEDAATAGTTEQVVGADRSEGTAGSDGDDISVDTTEGLIEYDDC